MRITTYQDAANGFYYICLCGELDACSSIALDEEMEKAIEQHPKQIQIDCKSLQYISSAGLGVFISYLQRLHALRIELILYNISPAIRNIFDITGLQEYIHLYSGNIPSADIPVLVN